MNLEQHFALDNAGSKPPSRCGGVLPAFIALCALGVIALLAFFAPEVALTDRIVLLPLGLASLVFLIPALMQRMDSHPDIAAFVLTAAMFVIYGLARSVGPDDGFALRFAALPDDPLIVPYSAYVVIFAALISSPLWWSARTDWLYAIVAAIIIIALLTLISFTLLRGYFPTGPTEILDPGSLPSLAMNLVEYGCMALLCHAVAARKETRRWALRLLPGVLLLLWARHQFFIAPADVDAESA